MKKESSGQHRGPRIARIGCSGLLLVAASLFPGCSKGKTEAPPTKVVETNNDPDVFTMQSGAEFPLTTVQVRQVTDQVHVTGVVTPDVNLSVPVVSLGSGRVVEIKTKLGDYVTQGQVLLLLNSPDFSSAFSDYQKFKADEELAAKQVARAQLLYDKGAIAQAELEAAQDADAKAKVDLQTAITHVHVLGGDINHPSPLLAIRAPISGTIVDQQTTGGTGVRSLDNQTALFTIADLSRVWVLCDVYQDMLARVHVGDIAEISIDGFPHDEFPGRVTNISEVLDPNTRTAKVRIEIPNPNHIMRAGMYVTAMFRSPDKVDRVVVPASAIVHLHDKDWVYVPIGDSRFRRIAVQLGPQERDGYEQVITGLKPNDQIVTNALQFSSAAEE